MLATSQTAMPSPRGPFFNARLMRPEADRLPLVQAMLLIAIVSSGLWVLLWRAATYAISLLA